MTMRRVIHLLLVAVALGPLGAAAPLFARNVDLSTVPKRNSVQLTIYNSEDLTLVRETRTVTFKKGINPLQFSWANTLIDPTSVELKFLTSADKLDVLDTTYPHDKPQQLYWNVQSEIDGEPNMTVVGWDDHEVYSQRIRNYSAKAVRAGDPPHAPRPRRLPQST
jgi:hypothetical protein